MLTRDQIRLRRDTDRPAAYFVVVRHNGRTIGEVIRDDDVSAGYYGRWEAVVWKLRPGLNPAHRRQWTDSRARAVEYVLVHAGGLR